MLSNERLKRLLVLNVFNAVGFIVLNGGLRLGIFPYLSRLLGPEQFGDFLTAYSIANTIVVLSGISLVNAMVRMHAGFEEAQKQVFFNTITMSSLALSVTLVGVFLAVAYGLDGFLPKVNLTLFVWPLAFYLCTFFIEIMLNNVFGCQARYIARSMYDVIVGILCLAVFPLGYFWGKTAAVYSLAFAFGTAAVCQLIRIFRFSANPFSTDFRYLRNVLAIAPFYMGAGFLDQLLQYGQRWLLGYYLGAESVTFFFIGTTVALLLIVAIGMISQLETLMLSQRATVYDIRKSELKLLLIGCAVMSVGLPVAAYFLSTPVNILMYGADQAAKGARVSYIVLPMLVFVPMLMIFRPVVIKFCSPKVPLLFSTIIGLSAVLLGVFFVRRWGLDGAAWATTLTAVISGCLFGTKFIKDIYLPVLQQT